MAKDEIDGLMQHMNDTDAEIQECTDTESKIQLRWWSIMETKSLKIQRLQSLVSALIKLAAAQQQAAWFVQAGSSGAGLQRGNMAPDVQPTSHTSHEAFLSKASFVSLTDFESRMEEATKEGNQAARLGDGEESGPREDLYPLLSDSSRKCLSRIAKKAEEARDPEDATHRIVDQILDFVCGIKPPASLPARAFMEFSLASKMMDYQVSHSRGCSYHSMIADLMFLCCMMTGSDDPRGPMLWHEEHTIVEKAIHVYLLGNEPRLSFK